MFNPNQLKIVILRNNDLKVVHILSLFNRNVLEYSKRPKDPKIFLHFHKKRTSSPAKIPQFPQFFFQTIDIVLKRKERERSRKDARVVK